MKIKSLTIVLSTTLLMTTSFAFAQDFQTPAQSDSDNSQQMLEQVKVLQQSPTATANATTPVADNTHTSVIDDTGAPSQSTNSQVPNQSYGNPLVPPSSALDANMGASSQSVSPDAYVSTSAAANGSSNSTVNTNYTPEPQFQSPFSSKKIRIAPSDQSIQSQSYNGTAQNLLPMSPAQIHRLKQLYTASQFAAAAEPGTPPTPTATSLYVNLSPGSTPPAIRLAQGFVTSLVFLDATGSAWPVAAYDIGNPSAFDIQWNKKDNTLMIQARTLYTYGNLAVRLQGLNTPVMITLIPGQQVVDYRVDMRVPGYGPNAQPMPISGLPDQASPLLLDVLDGVPPQGSRTLQASDDGVQIWLVGDKLYLRTRLTLLSPGWLATMSSADGTNAYELERTPLLLMAENGKVNQIKVEGF